MKDCPRLVCVLDQYRTCISLLDQYRTHIPVQWMLQVNNPQDSAARGCFTYNGTSILQLYFSVQTRCLSLFVYHANLFSYLSLLFLKDFLLSPYSTSPLS